MVGFWLRVSVIVIKLNNVDVTRKKKIDPHVVLMMCCRFGMIVHLKFLINNE
jgi:hypothetical protein